MQKNVTGQKIKVFAFDLTSNEAKTGDAANITIKVSNDWAAAGALTDINPTETEDGYYVFDVTQAESNYDNIDVYPESSTADIQVIGCPATIVPVPANHANLGIEADGDLTKVNTLDGHTAQTGDSYDRLGAPAGGIDISDDISDVAADLAAMQADVTAIKAKTDNQPEIFEKNTPFSNFRFKMVLSSDHYSPATGKTVTAIRALDSGTFGAATNAVTEVALGWYNINLAAADLNGDAVELEFSASGTDTKSFFLKTA